MSKIEPILLCHDLYNTASSLINTWKMRKTCSLSMAACTYYDVLLSLGQSNKGKSDCDAEM